ncbi:hypothetical protein OROMI_017850 [Orobanche minor]
MFSSERSSGFLLSNESTLKNNIPTDGEFSKSRESNGSDFFQDQNESHESSGLARFRSAPSSFLAALLDSNADNSSSGDESEALFSALIDGPGPRDLDQKNGGNYHQVQYSTKQEIAAETEPRPGLYSGGYVGSYSVGMESEIHVSLSNNGNMDKNSSILVRQSSSPAGFLNGFGVMGEVGNYNHTDASSPAGGFHNQHIKFSSAPSSSSTSRFMPTIPETCSTENGRPRNISSSWKEPSTLKRNRDGDLDMCSGFSELENQNEGSKKTSAGLVSHLSLPKTSCEMAAVEKYLHFQQETTVPCQIRAKRGFATHPRSIAERMRRTRISDNMKKLQDLFPNMDKQTNTADMLDMAVVYIKDLQKQVQTLTETTEKCVCSKSNKLPTT